MSTWLVSFTSLEGIKSLTTSNRYKKLSNDDQQSDEEVCKHLLSIVQRFSRNNHEMPCFIRRMTFKDDDGQIRRMSRKHYLVTIDLYNSGILTNKHILIEAESDLVAKNNINYLYMIERLNCNIQSYNISNITEVNDAQ